MLTIETERLLLREPTTDDAEGLFAVTGPEFAWREQAIEPYSPEEAKERIRQYFLRRGTDQMRFLYFFVALQKEEAGLHRIHASVATDNRASNRLLETIGMRREGIAQDCIFAQGR